MSVNKIDMTMRVAFKRIWTKLKRDDSLCYATNTTFPQAIYFIYILYILVAYMFLLVTYANSQHDTTKSESRTHTNKVVFSF